LKKTEALYLVSVVSRIEYLEEQKPELFLSFRPPLLVTGKEWRGLDEMTDYMQKSTEFHCDEVKRKMIDRNLDEFDLVLRGAESVNKRVENMGRFFGRSR